MTKTDRSCTRCGKKHLGEFTWLELNNRTNEYQEPGTVPEGDSQGLFAFGKTCAHRALGAIRFREFKAAHPESFDAQDKPRW